MAGALRCGGSDLGRAGSKGLGFASMSNHSPHTSFQTTPRAGVELQAAHPGLPAHHLAREATPHFSPHCQELRGWGNTPVNSYRL